MSNPKTLILLGGSRQQVIAIQKARECGYRTVLCDYLPDNPGQHYADVFYQESTTDPDTMLRIAKQEHADGIIAYSSDPAAPSAAYVAEALDLPTNPQSSVETMSSKNLFRKHMAEAGLPCPKAVAFSAGASANEVMHSTEDMRWPIVIKPTDSSGSKGVTVIHGPSEMGQALAAAQSRSRNGILIAEEYIQASFPCVVGGDVFVVGGEVRFWGLMSCLRDALCPLVPVGERTPSGLTERQYQNSKDVIQRLVTSLGVKFGELNVEIIIGENDVPYVIELGGRAGGNMIPVQLSDASGIDLVRANVMCAVGDDPGNVDWEPDGRCFATYVLHSNKNGIYRGYELSSSAEEACYRRVIYKEPNSEAERFDGANKALGILFFQFENERRMNAMLDCIDDHVKLNIGGVL